MYMSVYFLLVSFLNADEENQEITFYVRVLFPLLISTAMF